MRKTLDVVALLLLVFTWVITAYAVMGANPLPARIPTHFNAAGQPDGWGTPAMLWATPGIASLIYFLLRLVSGFPSSFNFPMRIHPAARHRLEAIVLNMLSWLKAEVTFLFAGIQYWTIRLVHQGQGTLTPLFMPAVLIVVFGTIAWHIAAMRRAARAR